MRVAYRNSLEPHLGELSENIYSTIARSKILIQAKSTISLENWRSRAETSKTKLKELRLTLRYQLWGITDAMRTLALLPDWIEHARPFPRYSNEIFLRGHALGAALDNAILASYTNGRRPNWIEQTRVSYAARRLKDVYQKMKQDKTLGTEAQNLPEEE